MVLELGSVWALRQPVETSRNAALGQPGAVSTTAVSRCRSLPLQRAAQLRLSGCWSHSTGSRLSGPVLWPRGSWPERPCLLSQRGRPPGAAASVSGHIVRDASRSYSSLSRKLHPRMFRCFIKYMKGNFPLDRVLEPPWSLLGKPTDKWGKLIESFVSYLTRS